MTLNHDSTARLNQLQETIEKNRENLIHHDFEQREEKSEAETTSTKK